MKSENIIIRYLTQKAILSEITQVTPLTLGQSGAKLYSITAGGNKYILKHTHPSFHTDQECLDSYRKELLFYSVAQNTKWPFIPQTIYTEEDEEYGIILIMKYYRPIQHKEWNHALQLQAIDLCARLNSTSIESVSDMNLHYQPVQIDWDFSQKSFLQWKAVIKQHNGCFSEDAIDEIYHNLDIVCPILNAEPHYLCHGDYHPENLLFDGENLLICDWQNVGIGKSIGDISFFVSRAAGFGIDVDVEGLLEYYCHRLSHYKGVPIPPSVLMKEKAAASLLNIFSFWAYYLNNCPKEKVASQYEEMIKSYRYLISGGKTALSYS